MPPPCFAIQLRHPPSRSGTYFSPRLGAQSEQLQYPLQAGHGNVSAKRSNVNCGYLRANESRISTADMKGSRTAYRFSMQPSQYSLRHRSPVDATITEQRILGLRDLHLQWWQNVHDDDDDEVVVVVRRRFLGRALRRIGAGADIARARESASSRS